MRPQASLAVPRKSNTRDDTEVESPTHPQSQALLPNSFSAELHKPIYGEIGHDIMKVSWVIAAPLPPNPLLPNRIIRARDDQETLPHRCMARSESHARTDQSGGHTRTDVSTIDVHLNAVCLVV